MNQGTSRSGRAPRAALVSMLLFALTLWNPVASRAQSPAPQKAIVPTDIEAWYYTFDEEAEPPPALPDPVNPYGENTLHVGITGGREESRTYVTLEMDELPVTFELVAGTLILPINPDAATMNAGTARVQVCLSVMPAESVEGSFEEPPEVDCDTRSPADYQEKPYPRFVVELKPFVDDLAFAGLAVMPTERAKEQGDTWHVAFYGKKNEAEDARPITATLLYSALESTGAIAELDGGAPPGFTTGSDFGSSSGSGSVGSFSTSSGTDFGDFSSGTAPTEQQGQAAAPVQAQATLPDLQTTSARGPTYTLVWAVPLLLVAFAFYFGSALTRRVVLRWDPSSK